jgi:hypothetical protein
LRSRTGGGAVLALNSNAPGVKRLLRELTIPEARHPDLSVGPSQTIKVGQDGVANAFLNLGHMLREMSKEEKARACWTKALEAKPELAPGLLPPVRLSSPSALSRTGLRSGLVRLVHETLPRRVTTRITLAKSSVAVLAHRFGLERATRLVTPDCPGPGCCIPTATCALNAVTHGQSRVRA